LLHVATCLWDANKHSQPFSRCYNEVWVERLYRAFARNLTGPFRFVVFCDYPRRFREPIAQMPITSQRLDYGSFTEPYKLGEPMILVGLDTLIVGNIDHMAEYCMTADKIALPRDPYKPERSINGVALVPKGWRRIYEGWNGENDMDWLRRWPWEPIDDRFPGQVISLKFHDVRRKGLQGARIVYLHGSPKLQELQNYPFVKEHWI